MGLDATGNASFRLFLSGFLRATYNLIGVFFEGSPYIYTIPTNMPIMIYLRC